MIRSVLSFPVYAVPIRLNFKGFKIKSVLSLPFKLILPMQNIRFDIENKNECKELALRENRTN